MKKFFKLLLILVVLLTHLPSRAIYAKELSTTINNTNLIITFRDNKIDNNVENLILNSGGKVILKISELGAIEASFSSNLIPTIQKNLNVESITPSPVIKLQKIKEKISPHYFQTDLGKINAQKADLFDKYQWDIKQLTNNGESFNLEAGNHDVIVGIIDTGVDKDHPDLKSNFLGGKNLVPQNFESDLTETANPDDIEDRIGHGTHIAGTIAGNGRVMGVAPDIGFKSYRVFDSAGNTDSSIISAAIIQATKDNVKVINLSIEDYSIKGKCFWTDSSTGTVYDLGTNMNDYSLYRKAIKYAVHHGVTVITSAGNDSLDCSDGKNITDFLNDQYGNQGFKYVGMGIEVPGNIDGVINVSATTINNTITSYSNYGEGFIDIAAPGGDLDPQKLDSSSMCFSTYLNNSYTFMDGTSMAAPKVSATAALIISKYGTMSPKVLAKKLYKSAIKINTNDSKKYFGHGLINAYNALYD